MRPTDLTRLSLVLLVGVLGAPAIRAQVILTAIGVSHQTTTRFTYTFDADANTVAIAVDNTLLGPNGAKGTLMAFGFNVPDALSTTGWSVASLTFSTTARPNALPTASNWAYATPFELKPTTFERDAGILISGEKLDEDNPNGANPQFGIYFGEKATFVLNVPGLEASHIPGFFGTSLFSPGNGNGNGSSVTTTGMSARWQQVTTNSGTGLSDKGPGGPGDGPTVPVPEPSVYALGGSLLALGLALRRLRRR